MTRGSDVEPLLDEASAYTGDLVRSKSLVVCVGARGVGKSTIAFSLGIAGAALGRRTLVVTARPTPAFASLLGLSKAEPDAGPRSVDSRAFEAMGPGRGFDLSVDPVSPRVVVESSLSRLLGADGRARIVEHPFYPSVLALLAWSHEAVILQAAYEALAHGAFDLVVLDVPSGVVPLSFLSTPRNLARLFEDGSLGHLLTRRELAGRGTSSPFEAAAAGALGGRAAQVAASWFGLLAEAGDAFHEHAEAVRGRLTGTDTSFVVVTTSDAAPLRQASFIVSDLRAMKLPFAGYVLNRSWGYTRGFAEPATLLPEPTDDMDGVLLRRKFLQLADIERYRAQRDRSTLARLSMEAESGAAVAVPQLGDVASLGERLALVARNLVRIDLP